MTPRSRSGVVAAPSTLPRFIWSEVLRRSADADGGSGGGIDDPFGAGALAACILAGGAFAGGLLVWAAAGAARSAAATIR